MNIKCNLPCLIVGGEEGGGGEIIWGLEVFRQIFKIRGHNKMRSRYFENIP